jgi:5'-deoxynucleotidase YfbR-like HD superfamily hydrolase
MLSEAASSILRSIRQFRKLDNIKRYAMMRCRKDQSVSEHTLSVVVIVHILAYETLPTEKLCLRAIVRALFHDFTETFIGDIPYDVKFMEEELKRVLEKVASKRLDHFLNDVNLPVLYNMFTPDVLDPNEKLITDLVKFADILELYLFCEEEVLSGNLHMLPVQQRAKDMIQNCKFIQVSETARVIATEIGRAEIPESYEMINSYPGPLLADVIWEKIEAVFKSILRLRRKDNGY